jgi:gas vesicle protein
MRISDLSSAVRDLVPFQRKRASNWIVPACLGLGVGLAAGVGLGLLVAPQSGASTRLRLRAGASRVKERARLAAQQARSAVSEIGERASAYGDELRTGT